MSGFETGPSATAQGKTLGQGEESRFGPWPKDDNGKVKGREESLC